MTQMSKTMLLGLLCLIVSGCTSIPVEQVDSRIGAWNGQPIDELIKYWGLPSNQRKVGDKNYAEWLNRSSEPGNASVSIGTGSHSGHSSIGIGLTLFDLGGKDDQCSRLVTYNDDGKVIQIQWQGTRDYCFNITPELATVTANAAAKNH